MENQILDWSRPVGRGLVPLQRSWPQIGRRTGHWQGQEEARGKRHSWGGGLCFLRKIWGPGGRQGWEEECEE